jgi:hypothetical protein
MDAIIHKDPALSDTVSQTLTKRVAQKKFLALRAGEIEPR